MRDLYVSGIHDQERMNIQRPLGELSTYAVETLPIALEKVRAGTEDVHTLVQTSELLVGVHGRRIEGLSERDKALATLDLKMIEAGIVQSGGTPGEGLADTVTKLSTQATLIPGLSYEEIVMINPLDSDPRLFTRDAVGASERDFYRGHLYIEGHFDEVILEIKRAIMLLHEKGEGGVDDARFALREANQQLAHTHDYMQTIAHAMPRDHFAEFRRYLGTHPLRETNGPSGAFSSGIPVIDILQAGNQLPEGHQTYIENNMAYFPRAGRDEILQATHFARQGLSLHALSRALGRPSRLEEDLMQLSQSVRLFRGLHYRGVRHQIPDAIAGELKGTGGEDNAGSFLRQRMAIRHTE